MPHPSPDPAAYCATEQNFPTLVVKNSFKGLVLVDFWAPWAGPSQRQAQLLSRLAQEYGGRFLLVTVDTDREKAIAELFGVKSLPSCKLFRRGVPVEHVRGMQSEAHYRALIHRHLGAPGTGILAEALKAWESGEHAQALRMLADAAIAEPQNSVYPTQMATWVIRDGRVEDAFRVLDALPPALRDDARVQRLLTHLVVLREAASAPPAVELKARLTATPDDLDARLALAATRLVQDDVDAALALFAEIHRQDAGYRDGIGRRGLAALMDHLGSDDPRLARYRRLLFNH